MLSNSMDLDKKKKLEELRKRLQSMPEEDFKSLLDTSDDKAQRYWDTSMRQKGVKQPQFFTPQARENAKKNLAQNTKQWRESRSRYMTGRPNPEHGERVAGEGNPNYGKGYTYKELTTGFIGTAKEMSDKFNFPMSRIGQYASAGRPQKSGCCKGLHFERVGDVKRKSKVASTFFLEVTTNTKGTAKEMNEKFGITQSCLIAYCKRDKPGKKGKHKGLHFQRIDKQ